MEIYSYERNGTGHFTIESSTVEAKTSVTFLYWYFCHYLHVPTLAASSHSMHNKDDRHILFVWCIFILVDPIKSNMSSICEENLFALVLGNYVLWEVFINGLYCVI